MTSVQHQCVGALKRTVRIHAVIPKHNNRQLTRSLNGVSKSMNIPDQRDTASIDSGCDTHNGSHKSEESEYSSNDFTGSDAVPRRKKTEDGNDLEKQKDDERERRRSASILEVKEHAHARLKEELCRAQEELKLKDEECKKLSRVHDQMSEELEELTAKLFEEANKMVQDANVKRMNTEKLLTEARAKIDVLQAEVTALKTLVITSTPSMPNKHLHPQIGGGPNTQNRDFIKTHRRSTSHHNFTKEIPSWETPVAPLNHCSSKSEDGFREVDPTYFEEFHQWKLQPSLGKESAFMSRITKEDISPCMSFPNTELAHSLFQCILNNTLTIEPVHERNPFPRRCCLTQANRVCKYRVKLADSDPYYTVSQLARNRITAVCDFITYARYITQGLVKSDESGMYWEMMKLRKQMSLARLGLS